MTDILESLVKREIAYIGSSGITRGKHKLRVIIKANGIEVNPLYVDSMKLDRHYAVNFSDELTITCAFVPYDIMRTIVPNKTNLEITLIKTPVDPSGSLSQYFIKKTFKAHLLEASSNPIAGDDPLTLNIAASKNADIRMLSFQLYDMVVDNIRKKTWGGNFRDQLPMDAVGHILMGECVPTTAPLDVTVKGIHIVEGYTTTPRKHIVVGHLRELKHVPHLINESVGGLYPTGFNYYLQNQYWYVFPLYDCSSFSKSEKTLTVIKIPKHRLPSVDKSYRLTDKQVIILSTRETKHSDISEKTQLNHGNGVAFTDASRIMEDYFKTGDNKAVFQAKDNVTLTYGENRTDGNFIAAGDNLISNDYNSEFTKLAVKSGAMIQTIWENADVDQLYPAMPVRYIVDTGKSVDEVYGTLMAVETMDYKTNINAGNQEFTTQVLLTIFITRVDPMTTKSNSLVTNSKVVQD